jgi:hypothetical protein
MTVSHENKCMYRYFLRKNNEQKGIYTFLKVHQSNSVLVVKTIFVETINVCQKSAI